MTEYNFSSILGLMLYLFYLGLALYFIYDLVFKSTIRSNPIVDSRHAVASLCRIDPLFLFWEDFRKVKIYSRKGLHDERLKKELSARQVEELNAAKRICLQIWPLIKN